MPVVILGILVQLVGIFLMRYFIPVLIQIICTICRG